MPDSIFRRIKKGDRAAVAECIARHGGLVWSLARRFSEGHADAEDAVQEIFIELWTHAGRFDESVASESTFVAMIARRKLIDRRRKQDRRPRPVALGEPVACRVSEAGIDRVDRIDEAERAAQALDLLSADQRLVLTRSIYHGLTYDQIARETGMPLGTVKTHARRGLIRLREYLDAGGPGAPAAPIPMPSGAKGRGT